VRRGGCRHGSGVLWVRGSDCWAAAGSGGHSAGRHSGGRHGRRCGHPPSKGGTKGTNVAGVVLLCASALVGIFFIVVSVGLYVENRDLAAHGVRTQGEVVWADAEISDLVFYTVGGTDYEVPGAEVGDRLPGEGVTVVYDPRDPAISNLEDDWVAWHLHWVLLGVGLFFLAIPAVLVVAGVFEADGPVGRRLARARRARRGLAAQLRPVTPLDEKVSEATLVEWAAWAASTTFSSTGLRFGYNKREVDAFRSTVRDTFLGGAVFWVSTPPVRSDDVRGKQFPTQRRSYDKTQVDAFLEAAGLRLAAMEATDRPAGPLVSDALLVAWAEWADSTTFSERSWTSGYEATKVDAFREKIRDTFLGARRSPVRADKVRGKQFSSTNDGPRYDKEQVAAFLDAAGIMLAAMESADRPPGPLVSGAILAKWADSTRFSTSRLRVGRYDTAEVDAFRDAVRDTFLGVGRSPLTWRAPPGKQFTTTRRLRPGYDPEQVDAFLDKAERKLAAMESTDRPEEPLVSGTILTDGPSGPTHQDFQPPHGQSGPNGPTQQDFQPARGRATRRRRSTRSDKRFATRSSGSCNPRSPWMRPATSGSGWPGVVATTCSRLTPSSMEPNRGWRRCGRPTGDDAAEAPHPAQPALSCSRAVVHVDAVKGAPAERGTQPRLLRGPCNGCFHRWCGARSSV
jgi:DivIVA domain-containing protein